VRFVIVALISLAAVAAAPTRAPVLIELFTSEGCSSCPPADKLLTALDAQAIVLGEHVDYWDHQGWRDPYSSHASTLRQESYARRFGLAGPYTPQMVVDGAAEFNGADGRRAAQEIERARARQKAAMRLARVAAGVEIEIAALSHSADVFLATVQDSGGSQVAAGENNGRYLQHVAIVRSLRKIGTVKKGAEYQQTVELPADAAELRLVAFAQETGTGAIYGVAVLPAAIR
jgi:hypothetical protein